MRRALASILFAAPLLAGLGPELTPHHRSDDRGWVASLHEDGKDQWQVAIWYPAGLMEMEKNIPTRTRLRGDKGSISNVFSQSADVDISPLGDHSKVRRDYGHSAWSVDKARWAEGRPFQLEIKKGMSPFSKVHSVLLEIKLGPEPGKSEGIQVRLLEKDEVPVPLPVAED